MNSNTFHLAIEVGDLTNAIDFYTNILGCESCNSELPHWIDINFWGNELTLHSSSPKEDCTNTDQDLHAVDMGSVVVPHFGVHLEPDIFEDIKQRILKHNVGYVQEPYIRFLDTELEQETCFIKDPHGNILELKCLANGSWR